VVGNNGVDVKFPVVPVMMGWLIIWCVDIGKGPMGRRVRRRQSKSRSTDHVMQKLYLKIPHLDWMNEQCDTAPPHAKRGAQDKRNKNTA